MKHLITSIAFVALVATGAAAQGVPRSVSFVARLTDGGSPASGPHDLEVRLYPVDTGGAELWSEIHPAATVTDGLLYADLGSITPLDPATLAGGAAFLEVIVDGQILSPRVALRSVPYAIRTASAETTETVTNPNGVWDSAGHIGLGVTAFGPNDSIYTKRIDAANYVKVETGGPDYGEAGVHILTPSADWWMFAGSAADDFGGALGFYAGGATRMVLTPTGGVGIGTTAPTELLDVAAPVRLDGIRLFRKNSNNGSVSCDTFCRGSSWTGGVGACLAAKNVTDDVYIACDTVAGLGHNTHCVCAGFD